MIGATPVVPRLTALTPYGGARVIGLFATYLVFAAVLATSCHQGRGPAAAFQVLRGC